MSEGWDAPTEIGDTEMSTPFATAPAQAAPMPATERQLAYLRDLMLSKADLTGMTRTEATCQIDAWFTSGLSKKYASDMIEETKNVLTRLRSVQPARKPVETLDQWTAEQTARPGADVVPGGYYALDSLAGAINETVFYRVDRPTEGRWAGYVFVKLEVGPNERNVPRDQVTGVLRRIAEVGAREASLRYGREIGRCGVCHLQLTNDESRAAGIGPVCRTKLGW